MKNRTRVAPDVHPPMQCQQGPFWGRKFVKKLTRTEKNTLSIWLSGAIWTPTRRFIQRPPKNDKRRCSCFFSDEPCASAKHFFVNCPSFENFRYQLQLQFYVPPTWWEKQPGCSVAQTWNLVSHMPLQPAPMAYILQPQFLPKKQIRPLVLSATTCPLICCCSAFAIYINL